MVRPSLNDAAVLISAKTQGRSVALRKFWLYANWILLICLSILCAGCSRNAESYEMILRDQIQRYPKMQVQDVYKLVYEATMGNKHLPSDTNVARQSLYAEMNSIEASSSEPMMEVISPDSEIVRLNLRPYKAARGNVEDLAQTMMVGSRAWHQPEVRLEQWWKEIEELGYRQQIPFDPDSLRSFYNTMKEWRFPAVHHSEVYAKTYKPAYRVIPQKAFLPRAFIFYDARR